MNQTQETPARAENEERELKFPVKGLETVRARLIEMEAERIGPGSFEDNWVFDKNSELGRAGCVLRLRTDGQGARVTFKGPRRFEGAIKVRREIEIHVDSHEAARSLLEALGYSVDSRYQKKREEWALGGVTIALDHTPIGDFVEFEGERAEVVARRCGFEQDRAEPRSYLALYNDHRKTNPGAPAEMVFPEDEQR
jgi:predicted adenylyl cyclase CyaB